METPEKSTQKRAIAWLFRQVPQGRWWIAGSIAAGTAGGVLIVVQSWLLARLLHGVIMDGAGIDQVMPCIGGFVAAALGRGLLTWVREICGFNAGAAVRGSVRRTLIREITERGPLYTAGRHTGALGTAILEQVEALQPFYSHYLPQLALAVLIPGTILAVTFPLSWAAAGLLLATAPLIPMFMVLVGMGAETISQRHFQAMSRMSAHFLDTLRGLPTLKLFGRSRTEDQRIAEVSEAYRRRTMSVLRVAFLSAAVLEFFSAIAIALVAVYLGMSYLGYISFGTYGQPLRFDHGLFILFLAPEYYLSFRELGTHYHSRADAVGAADELLPVLSGTGPRALSNPGGRRVSPDSGIRVDHVSLAFDQGRRQALDDVSIDIARGEHVKIVGESGAGKTSLLHLILGFVTPDVGRVTVGQVPITDADVTHWRRQVAWVGQEPTVFYGSIADNIRLGNPQAGLSEIEAAARLARAWEFIERLPEGLDTRIGESGFGLSRGQAQRIALARAFLKDAPLLLLDEPTANLDRRNQDLVMDAVTDLARGKTLVLLTHRLEGIHRADRVVVMHRGRVMESGTAGELLDADGHFARLAAHETGGAA